MTDKKPLRETLKPRGEQEKKDDKKPSGTATDKKSTSEVKDNAAINNT